jgi:serine/threonine-protein kinase RsbW
MAGAPFPLPTSTGDTTPAEIRLTVPARAENLALLRRVLSALGEARGLPREVIEDMRLAVTEACANVLRHAYEGAGTIALVLRTSHEAIEVIVADEGRGIGFSPDTTGPGLGLPLIAAVTDSFEIQPGPSRGSRLVMKFLCDRTPPAIGFA